MGYILTVTAFALLAGGGAWLWLRRKGFRRPGARRSLRDHAAFLKPHVTIHVPPGEGPFPAAILMHGCGGPRTIMSQYAALAAANGAAAVLVDSTGARGISYEQALAVVCSGMVLRASERAGDLYAALELVRADPRIDADRLVLCGWSHGGWTILDALCLARAGGSPDSLTEAPEDPLSGVGAALVFYPYNGFPALSRWMDWPDGIPVEAHLVRNDRVCDDKTTARVFERRKARGADVRWDWFEGVTHGFDEPDHHSASLLRHDPEATERARALFADFLKRRLGV